MSIAMKRWRGALVVVLLLGLMTCVTFAQTNNMVRNAGVEDRMPFFWYVGQTGGTMSWSTAQVYDGEYSLKINKPSTGAAASWITGNQADTYWNSMQDVLYDIGGFIYLDGVTASATEGERVGLLWTFLDDGGSDIAGPIFLAADAGASGWQEVSDQVLLTSVPAEVYCEAIMESGATGTVYFDFFSLGSDPWTAGFFGNSAETPRGWMNWTSGDLIGYANTTDAEAYSGDYSAKLMENDTESDEMVFYATPVPAEPETDYLIGVYVKTDGMNTDAGYYPTGVTTDRLDDRACLNFFYHTGDISHSWSLTGGDQFINFDQREADVDWRMYWAISRSPSDATGVSLRARFNPDVTGTAYYDDFFIYKLIPGDNLVTNNDLETEAPFFWSENQTGGDLIWATDEAHDGTHSLKISKTGTGTAASWITGNQATTYWNNMQDVLYDIGGWVKVNLTTGSTTEGERTGLLWTFKDAGGADIAGPIFLAADPGVTDWQELTDQVLLTSVPAEVKVEAIMEENATGEAWFDDFTLGSDPWTAGFFGQSAETVDGWMHWSSGDLVGYAEVEDVGTDAHSGTHVVVMNEEDTETDEMVYYSVPVPVTPGAWYEFSVWVKVITTSSVDDSYYTSAVIGDRLDDRAALNFFFHTGDIENSWSLTGGDQFIHFDQRTATSDGWVWYRAVALAPDDANGASLRARFNPEFVGEVWYDDFIIREAEIGEVSVPEGPSDGSEMVALPNTIELAQNYPNPFNSTTEIRYALPAPGHVSLDVFDLLGRHVATLVDGVQTAGRHTASFSTAGENGLDLTSGVYFYRLTTPQGEAVRKMIFLK